MKNIIQFSTIVFLLLYLNNAEAQLNYIGLKDKANIREAQTEFANANIFGTYWPETQIIEDYLYIPTKKGIYRKSLLNLNDTMWQLYAFEGKPIRDFIKKNDTLLAATVVYGDSNLLLLSLDEGQTYIDYTPQSFFNLREELTILKIAQNPINPNTIIALHTDPAVSISYDFGLTWSLSNDFIGGYQDWFLDYNPNDTSNIVYTGEQIFFESFIKATYDNGVTWSSIDSLAEHCTHGVAFHPQNKDLMISYGEGRLMKSINQGEDWGAEYHTNEYILTVVYDPQNPEVVYAAGDAHGPHNTLIIYKSTNGGDTWQVFYEEEMFDSDGIKSLHIYGDKLIVYTLINGVFYLDLDSPSSIKDILTENSLRLFPNPADNEIFIESGEKIKRIKLYNVLGKLLVEKTTNEKSFNINVEKLVPGVYFLEMETHEGVVGKRFIKRT